MSFNYEREESIRRAKGRLDGGYDAAYVYDRLLSEGFNEQEAVELMKNLTGKPFKASPKPAPAPVEAPPIAPAPQVKPPVEASPIVPQSPAPAEVSPLESFAEAAQLSNPAEEANALANPAEVSQLESFAEAAQLSNPAEETASLASLINAAPPEEGQNSAPEQAAESASSPTAQAQSNAGDVRRQKDMAVMALQLLDGGYDSNYVYKKFIKEGYSHEEITAVLSRINSGSRENSYGQARVTKTSEAHRQEAAKKAISLLESGYNGNFVYQRLLNEGYSEEIARSVVVRITGQPMGKAVSKSKNEPGTYRRTPYTPSQQQQYADSGDGSTQVMIGVAMIVIGLAITFCSYQSAANSPGGGTYVVTFGLVIAGIFRVIKGLSQ